ncbi:TonB-dependent receptor [Riemerella anatipestifer]|uniref:TonB-dependent receptor n=1 Tax=Riemerella anatipestifer TaxID=34085 RepID=UPI0030C1D4CD
MKTQLSLCFLLVGSWLFAQVGSVNISVYDFFNKKGLLAKVTVLKTQQSFNGEGKVQIQDLPAGSYSFLVESEGYQSVYLNDIDVVPNQNISLSATLEKKAKNIQEVVISKSAYKKTAESPLSLRTLSAEEVQKNPGSNRDISKALLSLPGVGSTATFRNDLFIRGGASQENKFYIDGIEVPVINHFQTQGASGGPRGIITVDFIKDVDFYSGAFPANRNGVLSSLFEFNLKSARRDKIGYKAVIGLDDMQLMADGPLSKDQSWTGLFSVRKSNLQLLFKAVGLPFLPSYYDTNFKVSKKFKSGDEFYVLGIGALDNFKFNENAKPTLANLTLIEQLPINNQWSYTLGAGYRHLRENGYWLFTMSRSELDNSAYKYFRNIEKPENQLLDYHSKEQENKIRIDRNFRLGDIRFTAGGNYSLSRYYNQSFVQQITQVGQVSDQYSTDFNLSQYGLYVQGNYRINQWNISAGLRADGSDYSAGTSNPLRQWSPRLAVSYAISNAWSLNFNTGIYYQLPSYTALGYQENQTLVNRPYLRYIRNAQLVGGLEYKAPNNLRVTLESYYKKYNHVPFSLRNGVSLANLGGGFGVIGTEPLDARGIGETYGVEFLAQKRTLNDFYGILAYTYGYSRFSNAEGKLLPSSWDSRHILSLTAGKNFQKNWNLGVRFRFQSALPETPYNLALSQMVAVWDISNAPVRDFAQTNAFRGNSTSQMDIRLEKKWIFKKWQLSGYLDIINAFTSANPSNLPVVNLNRNEQGEAVVINPAEPYLQQRYQLVTGEQDRLRVLPYFGIIVEF